VHIRKVIEDSPFTGEGYRKIWARLRYAEIRTSKERVRRLMREHGLQAPCRPVVSAEEKLHEGVITTERPNEMWGTDMTTAATVREGQAAIFIAIDHCTSELVGIHACKRQDRFEALEPIRQGVRRHFGAFKARCAEGLKLRHDHGSNYMADDFQNEIDFLGIESSPAFVREPECNGCAERFMRTLKDNLLWVRHFETIEELRVGLLEFQRTYNSRWLLQRHNYRTPNQVFADLTGASLANAA
jgi:transposase InsO family protein